MILNWNSEKNLENFSKISVSIPNFQFLGSTILYNMRHWEKYLTFKTDWIYFRRFGLEQPPLITAGVWRRQSDRNRRRREIEPQTLDKIVHQVLYTARQVMSLMTQVMTHRVIRFVGMTLQWHVWRASWLLRLARSDGHWVDEVIPDWERSYDRYSCRVQNI